MRALVLLLTVLVSLVFAGGTGAKGLPPKRVCGHSECVQLEAGAEALIVLDYNTVRPAPPLSGYYRLEYRVAGIKPHLFVPHGNRLAEEINGARGLKWYSLHGPGPGRLQEAIRRLEPISVPAKWPSTTRGSTPAATADARDGTPYVLAAVGIALTLIGLALLARRLHLTRPKAA